VRHQPARAGAAAALVLALARAAAPAEPAPASLSARRGPFEIRDEWLLAQPLLTLPALSPDGLPAGRTRVALDLAWGSDFGWQRAPSARGPTDFLVDGEHRTLALDVRRGLTDTLTVGVRLPVRWRGGGFLDGIIDSFHDITGLPGGGRPLFPADRFRVEGLDTSRRPVPWAGRAGTGVGNAELLGHWAFQPQAPGRRFTAALVARASLPTGSGPFSGTGAEGGLQLVAACTLHRALDVYAGGGGVASAHGTVDAIEYARARGQGFLALEWRPARRWSLVAEVDASTRLVRNLVRYPEWQAYFRMGAAVDVSPRWRVHGGFVEGIKSQQATTDFGIVAGVARTF
jgi:hypothetical protein